MSARVRLTREVLDVLFARPLDPRSRWAFVDALTGGEEEPLPGLLSVALSLCVCAQQQEGATQNGGMGDLRGPLQPQQRMLLDGEVLKRSCIGPVYASEEEQQQQRDKARGPFGQVLPQLVGCFQILYPHKPPAQQPPPSNLLQHLFPPTSGCQAESRSSCGKGSTSACTQQQQRLLHHHQQLQGDEQKGPRQQVLQKMLGILSSEEQQLVAAEGELLLAAVTSLQQLLQAAALPPSIGRLEWALPQLLRVILQPVSASVSASPELQIVFLLPVLLPHRLSNLEDVQLNAAAEQLQQLLAFSGEVLQLLSLLQTTSNRLTTSSTQQQPHQLCWDSQSELALAAELERELSHALHLSLLLQAAADASTGRCCCMRLLMPLESPNYDTDRLLFGVFLDVSVLFAQPHGYSHNPAATSCLPDTQMGEQQPYQQPLQSLSRFTRVGGGGYMRPFLRSFAPAGAAAGGAPVVTCKAAAASGCAAADAADASAASSAAARESSRGGEACERETQRGSLVLSFDLDLESVISLFSGADTAAAAVAATAALKRQQREYEANGAALLEAAGITPAENSATEQEGALMRTATVEGWTDLLLPQKHLQQPMPQQHSPLQQLRRSREPWVILTTASSRLVPLGVAVANRLIRRGVAAVMRIQPVIEVSRFQETLRRHFSVKYHVVIQQQQKTSSSRQQQQAAYDSAEDDATWFSSQSEQYIPLAACARGRASSGGGASSPDTLAAAVGPVIFGLTQLQQSDRLASRLLINSEKFLLPTTQPIGLFPG
ncbi:protein kinase (incomplete catalytic triad) [Cyclospora cayetanensis]|uniref:Protein kinase (Incomplete catalytic triad) n=1 Tax=Cyclospora cayetanensis TaxID=88456 RepID=A0A1D3D0R2_9EIME|nr:protein kinase (incomplete catalytic triad) [Cyclospora cayetanensis]